MAASLNTYENHLDREEARWFAVYTRYKREKIVCKRLEEQGIEVYLPLQKLTRQWTRKVREVELPLISCYIFTKIKQKDYIRVIDTPDVVNFVKFSKNLIAIPEAEIDIMRRVVGEGISVVAEPSSYKEGDEVEIISGNLTGLKGILIAKENKKDFVIQLEHLGYSLRMNIPSNRLKKRTTRLLDRLLMGE